jgi:hypothetical protein
LTGRSHGGPRRFAKHITQPLRGISSRNLAWDLYLAGRYDEALETIKGNEMVTPDVAVALYAHLGRLNDARVIVADWQKETRHSIATQACLPMKEPLNSVYLDDLRKAGLPEK